MGSPGMSRHRLSYLVCYDIAESPRRLTRVRRKLVRVALPVQYSVFWGTFTDGDRDQVLGDLGRTIVPGKDDVRFYPVPQDPVLVMLGRPVLPDGVQAPWLSPPAMHAPAMSPAIADPDLL